jgi:hypothetical protein
MTDINEGKTTMKDINVLSKPTTGSSSVEMQRRLTRLTEPL